MVVVDLAHRFAVSCEAVTLGVATSFDSVRYLAKLERIDAKATLEKAQFEFCLPERLFDVGDCLHELFTVGVSLYRCSVAVKSVVAVPLGPHVVYQHQLQISRFVNGGGKQYQDGIFLQSSVCLAEEGEFLTKRLRPSSSGPQQFRRG